MERFTLAWVLFTLCLCSVLGRPAKQKSSLLKTIVKRWDLIVENDLVAAMKQRLPDFSLLIRYAKLQVICLCAWDTLV
ncbi:unnamed protein product [Pocillopora meandrina]|uniref:Uncharacterized protein n=1 Tax=Pocillopora meandrina TaxID=46732 RepID=A0AAU9WLU5_9CNID|nr:unnamed protein product [Pocillopora meandrina]